MEYLLNKVCLRLTAGHYKILEKIKDKRIEKYVHILGNST